MLPLLISGRAFQLYNNHLIDLVATLEIYYRITKSILTRPTFPNPTRPVCVNWTIIGDTNSEVVTSLYQYEFGDTSKGLSPAEFIVIQQYNLGFPPCSGFCLSRSPPCSGLRLLCRHPPGITFPKFFELQLPRGCYRLNAQRSS